jgi:hypothetical protein
MNLRYFIGEHPLIIWHRLLQDASNDTTTSPFSQLGASGVALLRCSFSSSRPAVRRCEGHRDPRLSFPATILGALAAVVVAASQPASLAQTRPPELIDIVPVSGPAGEAYPLQATIRGTGFVPAGNAVQFGPVTIPDLPSVDGVQITFDVPKLVQSRGEVPPMVLAEGAYPVTVTTSLGRSNSLIFMLTRQSTGVNR